MPPLAAYAAIAALSIALAVMVWVATSGTGLVRKRTVTNLRRGLHRDTSILAGQAPESVLPEGVAAFLRRFTPAGLLGLLDRLLGRAGRPNAWTVERLLAAKALLLVIALALGGLYYSAVRTTLALAVALVVAVVAFFLPELLLQSRGQERQKQITLQLPNILDQMSIAVAAGLGFDAAMSRVARNSKGALSEELVRTLQDIQFGVTRAAAYESLGARTGVPELRRFVRAVIQAETYGVALTNVLETQAAELRIQRRQRAEESAMQIPVKVVFPLILCILPVLLIVLLGPSVIGLLEYLGR